MSASWDIHLITEGGSLNDSPNLHFAHVEHAINRIPRARVQLLESKAHQGEFNFARTAAFAPGATLSIKISKERGVKKKIFEGIVARTQFRKNAQGPVYELELLDPAYRLTRQRNFRVFKQNTSDQNAFKEILKELKHNSSPAVKLGKVEMPVLKHKNLVQHDLTDWDFICMRADACGCVVVVEDGVINIVEPKLDKQAGKLTYGDTDVLAAEITADAQDLISGFESWNKELHKTKATVQTSTLFSHPLAPKHFKSMAATKALGGYQLKEYIPTPLPAPELKAYTNGRVLRGKGAGMSGYLRLNERNEFTVGKYVSLKDFGLSRSDRAYISGVSHQIDSSGWTVDVQLGLSGQSYQEEREWNAPEAQGLLGPAQGLHYAEVTKLKKDKEKKLLVQVSVPGEDKKTNLLWATLATPYAGKDHSVWFHPEVGDLVVLAYMNNDPRYPVILGGIHRALAENPVKWDAQNKEKGIILRKGVGILFNDQDGTVKITTATKPAEGQTILLDKKKGEISLNHKTKSKVIINDKGLTIDTKGDLKINANKIDINGKAITIKGSSIDLK